MPEDEKTSAGQAKSSAARPADHNPDTKVDGKVSAKEIGGRPGPDPTRYGDWEKNGRCIDF
jgi:hypothetical protein